MIEIPYKLDLILDTIHIDNNKINQSISQTNQIDQTKLENLIKPIVDIEVNTFVNKLKFIVLNMSQSEVYWLRTDIKTGFNLNIEITNKNRLNEDNYSEYVLANGIVGPIKLNNGSELRQYIKFDTNELIIKTIDYQIENINEFINKWNLDKNLYPLNIPEIYFYGSIINNSGDLLSYYYMTKKYHNYVDIVEQTNFNFSLTYLKKILGLLNNLISRKYVYHNLNLFGLGYEIITMQTNTDIIDFQIIILDYTIKTLLSLEDDYFEQFKFSRCGNKKCIGNIIPYYIIDDYYNLNPNWLKRLKKSYSLGLVEIMLVLFYNDDKNLENIYNFLIGPSILESQLHYYHFYKRLNSDTNVHNLIISIHELVIRFCNINPIMELELKNIIINLIDKNYDKIYYPSQILYKIKKIEESNNDFEIEYNSKNEIHNPVNYNYLRTNIYKKQKILSENNYKLLYKKYKMKYLRLKNKF